MDKSKERWCNKCDDYRIPKEIEWESSIAKITDLECPNCREIFDRKVEQKEVTLQRGQLELNVHHALSALSDYFKVRDDPLQYEVNRLWQGLDKLRAIPEFPKPPSQLIRKP